MLTSRRVRILGWLLLGIGLFLIAFMGYITLQIYPTSSAPGAGDAAEGGRFTGDVEQGRMILNVFWLVIAVGALVGASTASGRS